MDANAVVLAVRKTFIQIWQTIVTAYKQSPMRTFQISHYFIGIIGAFLIAYHNDGTLPII